MFMGLGLAVQGFNKVASGFNWVQGRVEAVSRLCKQAPGGEVVIDFLSTCYQKVPGQIGDVKTCFLKPAGLIYSSVKYFEWKWVPTPLVEYSKHATAARSVLQATEVFREARSVGKAFSNEIKGGTVSSQRKLLVVDGEVVTERDVLIEMSAVRKLFAKGNVVAMFVMALGYFTHELSVCAGDKFPRLLDRSISWLQMGAGVYMCAHGAYAEWEFVNETKKKKSLPQEKNLTLANYAMNAAYLFYSIVGMAGLYYGKDSGAMLKRLQFVASLGTTIVPVAHMYIKEQRERQKP